jgi:gp32 DNA binding protein like
MSSFANLKRNRSSLETLTKAIEQVSQPNAEAGSKDDTRFWQPSVDKSGNGMATIRFLPAPAADGDDALPWVRVFNHGFQGPGGWFIDNCLTTVNDKCPVCEHNSTLWNSGIEANKEIARKQKRKLTYIANILVVSDPSNPQNEGQIKLFKFGKKIFDKISEAMNPEFADETPVNPFDMWEGANFKLKIRNVEGYRNYDKSEFADKSALFDGSDEKLEELWKNEYSLKDFTDPKQFKPYEQLKTRLDKVLGFDGGPVNLKTKAETAELNNFKDDDLSVIDTKIAESDEDMDYFKSLAAN